MLKPNQQFRVDTIEELKEAYKNLKFLYPLEKEIEDFECRGRRYVSCGFGRFILFDYDEDLQIVPNPFKKYTQPEITGIDKAIDDLSNEAKKLGFLIEVIFKNIK